MEKMALGKWIAVVAILVFGAVAVQGRTVREALDALLSTRYCATATADGMDLGTALQGKSPISGGGVFSVPEEEWLPVLLEMAGEELEACKRDTAADIAEIRSRKTAGEQRDTSEFLWVLEKRIRSRIFKLTMMVACLQCAEGGTGQVLDMLERIGLESPPEFNISSFVANAVVKQACHGGQFARCLELGHRYRELRGAGCCEEFLLCHEFGYYGLPLLEAESDRRASCKYLLEFAETLENVNLARAFDEMAVGVIPGWVGSVQRRRLATRFHDEPIPRFHHYHPDTKEIVEGEIDERRLPQMLNRRAAAELAADESELTDLREVYGDWTKEGEEE